MSYSKVPAGKDVPNDIYVAIEIPANHAPIKYEIDHDTDCLFVDRFMATPMFYPANYGFIPHTLADDGDPLDVLVVTPYPVAPGSVIRCRPVGVLNMTDEAGGDAKLIAVPHDKLSVIYKDVQEYTDLPALLLDTFSKREKAGMAKGTPREWLYETAVACRVIYDWQRADGTYGKQFVTDTYLLPERQLILASYRLAAVLNDLFG